MTITTKRNLILASLFALSVWAMVWGVMELGNAVSNVATRDFAIVFIFAVFFGLIGAVMSGVALLRRIWTEAE
jgi:uncharacterized ion transporter superfamily protein YfcC